MTLQVDLAVIGAGPAGSTLAALLAARGVSVALIDRDLFPRDKLCGEFLSWDALPILERLGVMDTIDGVDAPSIRRCRVVGSHRTHEIEFPHQARGVSRRLFDELLLQTAVASGARRLDGWRVDSTGGGIVTIVRDGTVREIQARIIAGAWGRWGRFDQQLGRGFVRERSRRHFGFKRHYTARSPTTEHDRGTIELYSFDRGYLGVNAIEGGLTNICGLVHAERLASHKGRWEAFVETLRDEEPVLDELYRAYLPAQDDFLSSDPVIFRARSAVEGGIFMIGDASGVIDPLTGNGMAMAIQSALLVAPEILRLLETPARRESIENDYRQRHARFFHPRIAWSRAVASLMSRPRLLDAALTGAGWTGIGATLVRRTRGSRDRVSRLADAWFC